MESDRGKPLAGKSTLNRLELTPVEGPNRWHKSTLNRLERTPLEGPDAYKKIVADPAGMDELLVGGVCGSASRSPRRR